MADKFSKETRSKIMASIRSKNTKIEVTVFRYLRKNDIYFKKHYRKIPGCPDIACPRKKLAVFIDGDFWHGFRFPLWKNRLGSEFWIKKIQTNRERDQRNFKNLKKQGWKIIRVWEHQLIKKEAETLENIRRFLINN